MEDAESVKLAVTRLEAEREEKQWRVQLLGRKDIVLRDQVENLVKFAIWSNGVVSDALSAQPYAALAWSGVQILLPVGRRAVGIQGKLTIHSF